MYVTTIIFYKHSINRIFLLQEDDLFNYFSNQLHINDNQLFVVVTGDNNNWIASDSTLADQHNTKSLDKR